MCEINMKFKVYPEMIWLNKLKMESLSEANFLYLTETFFSYYFFKSHFTNALKSEIYRTLVYDYNFRLKFWWYFRKNIKFSCNWQSNMRKKFVPSSYESLLNYIIIFVHIINKLEHYTVETNLKDHAYYSNLILLSDLFYFISIYCLVSQW